jgi:hypothetical protein
MHTAIGIAASLIAVALSSCTGTINPSKSSSTPTSAIGLQTYFTGAVSGSYAGSSISDSEFLSRYIVDDTKRTFSSSIYTFGGGNQEGPQLDYAGNTAALSRGVSELGVAYSNSTYGSSATNGSGISYDPPLGYNWIFQLPDQAGGFINLKGMPFVPAVPAVECPAAKSMNYNFVSVPTYIGPNQAGSGGGIYNWDPLIDTAYGSVQIAAKGSEVDFSNIAQYTVSGSKITSYADIAGNPAAITAITGACDSTFYGNTISVPSDATVNYPGVGESIDIPSVTGIGPSGLLVESDGETSNLVSNATVSGYQPFLGSGTGALGLPQPSSAIDTSTLGTTQFIGAIYGGGTNGADWTSEISSFGFPSAPSSCPAGNYVAPLFGGDFPNNDPRRYPSGGQPGYGNCDVVIDLGVQDSSTNGLYPSATVYLSAGFAGNAQAAAQSFPAVAIAGQLDGKYAVFVIGVDAAGSPQQAWGIYLFQSN